MKTIDTIVVLVAVLWTVYQAIKHRKESLWIVFMSLALFNGVFALDYSIYSTIMSATYFLSGILLIGYKLLQNRLRITLKMDVVLLIILCVVLYMMLPKGYIGSADYGSHKIVMLVVHALFPAIVIRVTNTSNEEIELFLNTALPLTIFMLLRSILGIGMTSFRLSGGESGALGTARILSVGLILTLEYLFINNSSSRKKQKAVLILLIFLFSIMIFLTGSRAGILYSVISFVLTNELFKRNHDLLERQSSVKFIFLGSIVLFFTIAIGVVFESAAISRILSSIPGLNRFFFSQHAMNSNEGRADLISFCINYIKSNGLHPIGTGEFHSIHPRGYRITYPHNIFFEILIENGIVTLFLLFGLLFKPIRTIFESRKDNISRNMVCLSALFIFFLLDSLTSGDIAKNFQIWSISSLILCCSENNRNMKEYAYKEQNV